MNLSDENKFVIRGTREGLWFEVAKISDNDDILNGGELVATFEIDYSPDEKKFKLTKIKFKENIDMETKVAILNEVKDFVESLNQT